MTIKEALAKLGYKVGCSDDTYSHVNEYMEWYQNDVRKFHKFKVYNGIQVTSENMFRLGMAKKICEDWATLLLNEKVNIKAGDFEKHLNEILNKNNFRVKGNQLIEIAFALGTGAFVEYKDATKNIVIDYIRADMIYPLSWRNGTITECAFGSIINRNGKEYIYLQIHRLGKKEDGEKSDVYYIENAYINKESGEKAVQPENIEAIVNTESDIPLFQIITPNIFNNIDLDSPLGISVYANAIDELKGCDTIYDSYINEFKLGKKRILVPLSSAKMQMQKSGVTAPTFDPNDNIFYSMPGEPDAKITEVDMSIRAQEHELGIQRSLDLLSLKCGMGAGRYKFDSTGVKTATEVISDKSDLFQNLKKNEIIINAAIVNLVKAIAFLDGRENVNVTVDFDDSIIEDSNTTIDRNIKLVQSGLRSKLTAIMEINKCTEAEAKKELGIITEENQITGQSIDWTNDDVNNEEQTDEPADEPEDS